MSAVACAICFALVAPGHMEQHVSTHAAASTTEPQYEFTIRVGEFDPEGYYVDRWLQQVQVIAATKDEATKRAVALVSIRPSRRAMTRIESSRQLVSA